MNTGGTISSLIALVDRIIGRQPKQAPERTLDYSAEFDQSRHAVSIEESRERSVGCWDRPDDSGD